ncbi:uroporphyrinogen-III C-methyltransferase [Nitrospirillum sp. BR 11163]|uniref:uroporphyrinogen-III C-methyltransferase n=1 Tax=Nitrospirillum sp. BR 11163 TaxID=3104323 RepID=UPI002AFF5931|nr:uroporphyrinogen-III C-methyltransferase [Nitrospirillum sp. BR 11163]MEA1673511.1 uroporphyrinogen-III C-methyltransferase [Nitrospirillum sp. BR 11163]
MTDLTLPTLAFPDFQPGSVWLVGAGPGDPGLLTLLALHALRQADHIVYDALVDQRILDLANPAAVKEFAGKRGGRPSPAQEDISLRLVELGRQGLRVLRLKAGDPFVFGRGGEEALALVAAGLPFRVVPGITAGLAGPAYAGIPATHRTANQAVILVTGQSAGDAPDWAALAATKAPLILYMAWRGLGGIAAALMAGGLESQTAVAVICDATTPRQKVMTSTLATCAQDLADSGLAPPAIIVIGAIAELHATLSWLGVTSHD